MKRTSVYVDGRRKNANGEFSVYVRVFDELTKELVKFSTGLTTPVIFKGECFPREVPGAEYKNLLLTEFLGTVRRIVIVDGDNLTIYQLDLSSRLEKVPAGGECDS